MLNEYNAVFTLVMTVISILGSLWYLSQWLTKQFSDLRATISREIDKVRSSIEGKIDYHEKHDDLRFATMSEDMRHRTEALVNDIWQIRVRNAVRDGVPSDVMENTEKHKI